MHASGDALRKIDDACLAAITAFIFVGNSICAETGNDSVPVGSCMDLWKRCSEWHGGFSFHHYKPMGTYGLVSG